MNFLIEKYKPQHKNEILSVWEESVLATHDFLDYKDFLEFKEMLTNLDFSVLNGFCLTQNHKVIGFMALHDSKIEMLFLNPSYIGQGLGKKLLNFAISNCGAQFVDVNEQNSKATNFYKQLGFEVFERSEKDDSGKTYPILKMKLK